MRRSIDPESKPADNRHACTRETTAERLSDLDPVRRRPPAANDGDARSIEKRFESIDAAADPQHRRRIRQRPERLGVRRCMTAEHLEAGIRRKRARIAGIEARNCILDFRQPLGRHQSVNEFLTRKGKQVANPVARSLKQPFDPPGQSGEHVRSADAPIARGHAASPAVAPSR
jgi:hypothetical protein